MHFRRYCVYVHLARITSFYSFLFAHYGIIYVEISAHSTVKTFSFMYSIVGCDKNKAIDT